MNGLGLVKGLLLTFKHFFATYLVDITGGKKSKTRRGQIDADGLFTIQYPEERREVYPRFRGRPELQVDEAGRIKCVACTLCKTVCPSSARSVGWFCCTPWAG